MVRVELARIIINEKTDDEQQITLREADGSREFSIFIGLFEASPIERIEKERPSERPLTHDLAIALVEPLEGGVGSCGSSTEGSWKSRAASACSPALANERAALEWPTPSAGWSAIGVVAASSARSLRPQTRSASVAGW